MAAFRWRKWIPTLSPKEGERMGHGISVSYAYRDLLMRGGVRFLGCEEACAFEGLFAHHVQAQEVG
jgi:hypothetical protein